MDYFYVVVLSIAVVLLILILTFIGLAFRSSKNSATWPPVAGSCPDYWDVDPTNQNYCIIPKWNSTSTTPPRNVGTIYKSDKTIDPKFNPPGYDSNNGRVNFNDSFYTNCYKKMMADKWGFYWDGYSNMEGCSTGK